MDEYKVLLVDDEEDIRVGISRRTDWAALGLSLVGEAENGADALELAESLRPDIVLTDIKMPFMDGLTLCQQLRVKLPAAKVVVFSGFDDFEYARKAIGMNVSQYILKPINAQELREVLQGVTLELDLERKEQRNMDTLRKRYTESLPVLRELFFTRLLDGHIPLEQIEERAARYEISLPQGDWVVALVHAELAIGTAARDELLLISVRSLFEQHFTLFNCPFYLVMYNDMLALFCHLPKGQAVNLLIDECNRICILSRSYLYVRLTIGVGRAHSGIHLLSLSAREARSALDYRVLSRARVIYLGDLEPGSSTTLAFEEADERAISSAIKLYGEKDIRSLLSGLMTRVQSAGTDLAQCQQFFLEITTFLLRLARSSGTNQGAVFGEGFSGILLLTDYDTLDSAMEWYCQCCLRLNRQLHTIRNDSNWRTVEQAKAYIGEHFTEYDLDVEALCDYLHLSSAYFSTLFKRETDMNFISYVTSLRMDRAVHLLQNTDEKTYLIAEAIGYTDPNYFSYVFKKQFGVSPSKYRNQLTNNS